MKTRHTIGEHRLIAALGKGGMANVFLALSKKQFGFAKLVVLKLMREDLGAEFVQMFMHEARLAARLNHPNVVQTYEVGMLEGQPFIAMEYLEGQALSRVLQQLGRENVPLEIQIRIFCDTLEGLHYAHELTEFDGTPLGIIHRDVSPQNVFVTYSGQAKIVDFGIAKSKGSERTASGILKGKTGYMAPEQISGIADRRTDVFAVGVMLWEAIAKKRLAIPGDEVAVLARRVSGLEEPIRNVVPNVDPELAAICDRALALDPNLRYQTARELRDALEGWLARTRPCDARQVGALLEQTFAEERTRIRRLIEQHSTAAVPLSSSGEVPLPDLATETGPRMLPTRVDADPLGIGSVPVLPTARQAFTSDTITDRGRPSSPPVGPVIALAALVLVGVAGLGFLGFRKHAASKAAASATAVVSAPSAPTAPAAPPSASPELPAAEPVTYVLTITSSPPDARVYSGEAVVGRTPLTLPIANASVAREPRQLVVKKDGFEPFLVDAVRSPADVTRHVELVPTKAGAAARPAARPATSSGTAQPRLAEPPDPRGLRPLDNGNPWEK